MRFNKFWTRRTAPKDTNRVERSINIKVWFMWAVFLLLAIVCLNVIYQNKTVWDQPVLEFYTQRVEVYTEVNDYNFFYQTTADPKNYDMEARAINAAAAAYYQQIYQEGANIVDNPLLYMEVFGITYNLKKIEVITPAQTILTYNF